MADDSARDAPEENPETSTEDSVEEPTQTPFDHPLFLPVILGGLMLWFFYDGFINTDPEMMEHRTFNQVGFAVLSVATSWFGWKGVKEMRQISAAAANRDGSGRPPPIV